MDDDEDCNDNYQKGDGDEDVGDDEDDNYNTFDKKALVQKTSSPAV